MVASQFNAMPTSYRGRFAPTPSGPLHLGSLLTALAGFLQARIQSGLWFLRMDDLDAPRCVPGVDALIQRQLEVHALHWDGAVRYQSRHEADYRAALHELRLRESSYACVCTRAVLARDALAGPDGPVYAGTCRGHGESAAPHALRLKLDEEHLQLEDAWQGRLTRHSLSDIGDFVLQRADGRIAYQLACVVDEQALGITEVVRGADLIGSSFRQIYLMRRMGLPAPSYRHLPVLLGQDGRKLSKQNHAAAADNDHASANLITCLRLLGQKPPDFILRDAPRHIVGWAIEHWDAGAVPKSQTIC